MPKRMDLKKVLVIGSGPIVIGQAAEFDYAGTQACLALKEEGYEVILANSITLTPGTITVSLEDNRFCVHCLDRELAEGMENSVFVELLKKMEAEERKWR